MLLDVEGLSAGYGSFLALRDVTMGVDEGEAVSLLGANGSGKTTLVRSVLGLVKPRSGKIRFRGERIDGLPPHKIIPKGISISPEGGGCFQDMSVMKNLTMGILNAGDDSRKAYDRVIDLFPILKTRKSQKAGSLSGGERQMLAIGRALMGTPKLLILDEPSLGLAPMVINNIFDSIGRLKAQGVTILLVEQNASKSLMLADRGYVVELGKISISGRSEELRDDERVKRAYMGM